MNLDLDQFNDIDFENIGAWPKLVKIVFAAFLSICVMGGSYYFFIADTIAVMETEQQKEIELRAEFESKYKLAANLKLYREQLVVMEAQFAELLKMLPSENEMPGLLDDVTFVATDSGLKINSLDWDNEIERDFYIEFPIRLNVEGDYHQIGNMVSGIAKLPRIVSLHDFTITHKESGGLSMAILAKTYRFKEGAELAKDPKKGGAK